MRTDSQEYKDLMKKWSRESWVEEMGDAYDDYLANEDMHGRLDRPSRSATGAARKRRGEK